MIKFVHRVKRKGVAEKIYPNEPVMGKKKGSSTGILL